MMMVAGTVTSGTGTRTGVGAAGTSTGTRTGVGTSTGTRIGAGTTGAGTMTGGVRMPGVVQVARRTSRAAISGCRHDIRRSESRKTPKRFAMCEAEWGLDPKSMQSVKQAKCPQEEEHDAYNGHPDDEPFEGLRHRNKRGDQPDEGTDDCDEDERGDDGHVRI